MSDTDQIYSLYLRLWDGMVRRDGTMLDDVLDDSFVMVHMTGQEQTKEAFIASVLDGTLSYYAVRHESMPVDIRDDVAALVGRSQATAETFGSRRETWRLEQTLTLHKKDGGWKITRSVSTLY